MSASHPSVNPVKTLKDQQLSVTLFMRHDAPQGTAITLEWPDLVRILRDEPACASKGAQRLFSLATLAGDYRAGGNVQRHHGIVGDYDAERVPATVAAELLGMWGIAGVIYTTNRHTPERPRWRVVVPLSEHVSSERWHALTGHLNAVLGGVLADESFEPSRAYYFSRAAEFITSDGMPLDAVPALPPPVFPPPRARPAPASERAPGWVSNARALGVTPETLADLRSALAELDADDRATWVACGQALVGLGETGREIWEEWSATSTRFPGGDGLDKWDSFSGASTGYRAIFAKAQAAGWENPRAASRRQAQVEEARRIGKDAGEPYLPDVMSVDAMRAGLAYIETGGTIIHRTSKRAYKREDARGAFAASRHTYTDGDGKTKTTSALSAWIADPDRVGAGVLTWQPGKPEFCNPGKTPGGHSVAYNTWRGLPPMTAPANWQERAGIFSRHLDYLIPVPEERHEFTQWLAHIVQRPGELPTIAYLMVTPTTGTGRNWLASVLARVLRGYVAAGVDIKAILDGGFNGILSETLLAQVDEVREGTTEGRYRQGEALKTIVTATERQINHKYGLQYTEVNCCRWLFFSNHLDALPFDNSDRRIAVIANPTQRQSEQYYAGLYRVLDDPEFIASVRELLATYSLAGFSPGRHARMNDAKRAALQIMEPAIDRAIREFMGAWPGQWATAGDLHAAIHESAGEPPKGQALAHALRRAGIKAGRRVRVNAVLTRVMAWGDAARVYEIESTSTIVRAIEEARKAY